MEKGNRRLKVALVCMPFYSARLPSIQLGILAEIVRAAGHIAVPLHLNLHLAKDLGPEVYQSLCVHRGPLLGEWLFGVAAFGDASPTIGKGFFTDFPSAAEAAFAAGLSSERAEALREKGLVDFVDRTAEAMVAEQFDVVGFTSTFQQQVASLALARKIKVLRPETITIFGGANVQGEMGAEHLRRFDWIDYVADGEAEEAFPQWLDAIAAEGTADVPGIRRRHHEEDFRPAEPLRNMDLSPVPNFDEYFDQAERLGLSEDTPYSLPIETSRGCWWGQKSHCTFCGLNGTTLSYRSKSPERVLRELNELALRYRTNRFDAVDNILDFRYLRDLLPRLADGQTDYRLFYEVKANLSFEQIRLMHRAGVEAVQPGIESFSTHVLGLMGKGSTLLHNVGLLKWCQYFGIEVHYNVLYGFSGETEADYAEQTRLVEAICHLRPPQHVGRIWLERFSPNFTRSERFGVHLQGAERSYAYVYPSNVDLEKLAYFFDYSVDRAVSEEAVAPLKEAVRDWRDRWSTQERPHLTYWKTPGAIFIDDSRSREGAGSYTLTGLAAHAFESCSLRSASVDEITRELGSRADVAPFGKSQVAEILSDLVRLRLAIEEHGKFLSLALPLSRNL